MNVKYNKRKKGEERKKEGKRGISPFRKLILIWYALCDYAKFRGV